MAVDDAELLALAGEDSSDDEAPQPSGTQVTTASPLPSIEISRADSDKFAAKYGKSASKSVRGSSGNTKKKTQKDESEEEGEASSTPATPNSQRSAPMSKSSSGSPAMGDAGDDAQPFPLENKFYSEKDKREIMSLPEIERESILADRAAQYERKMLDIRLRRIFQAREREEADAKSSSKRKADVDMEESPRKSSRQKTTLGGRKVGETSGAIEAYKRQREEKGQRDEKRRREGLLRKQNRAHSSSVGGHSDVDADGESEVEWDDGKIKQDELRARNAQPALYDDFRRVTWTRNMLAQFCFFPGFENAVRDCFVRTPSKPNPATQQISYDLLQVKRIIEKTGYDYAVEKPDGKRFVTNQHIVCVVDGAERDYYFGMVSNSVVSEVEVANFKNCLANDGKTVPLQRTLITKLDEIQAMINHRFTDAEIQTKLERSGAIKKRMAPVERLAILDRRRAAVKREDEAAIAKADADLAALDGPKLKYGTFLVDPRTQNSAPAEPSQQDRLAELNRINRRKNTQEVRRAQLMEQKAARLARQAVERGEGVQDPFARVKTHAKTHHDVNQTLAPHRAKQLAGSRDASRSASPAVGTPKLDPKKGTIKIPSPHLNATTTIGGFPVLTSRNLDDEFLGSLEMGIDVEI